ncbi:MAG: toll/interleukin-1 receptor domain-containing protein [Hyphomicrobiaceae bacterium]|nr:toll/interleukin-1 receptor domain-containing protein [Hyphomicrobiaceae bacterium]
MARKIYLSYRRSTDGAVAMAIAESLIRHFGSANVFADVSSLNAGSSWLDETRRRLLECDVVLVIIGRDWLAATGADGRPRLSNSDDFVRYEIAQALDLGKITIPVLIDDARLPSHGELPDDLRELTYRQSANIRSSTFKSDLARLLEDLERAVPRPENWPRRVLPRAIIGFLVIGGVAALWQAMTRLPIRDWLATIAEWLGNILSNAYALLNWRDTLLVFNSALLLFVAWRSGRATMIDTRDRSPQRLAQTHRVFICYRRDDSSYATSYIYDKLESMLGAGVIFKDVDSIPYGTDFRTHVQQKLSNCQVCLIVIGKSWLTVVDKNGNRRLFQEADPVRTEIETVLGRQMLVIPILVDSAPMPDETELPKGIEKLSAINGIQVRPHPDFQADVQRLASAIA